MCLCVHEKLSVTEASEEINFMFLNQNDVQYSKDMDAMSIKYVKTLYAGIKKGHFGIEICFLDFYG